MERREEVRAGEADEEPMSGSTILARIVIFLLVVPALLVYLVKIFTK